MKYKEISCNLVYACLAGIVFAGVLMLAGCQSTNTIPASMITPEMSQYNIKSLKLAPGDELEIKFPYSASFNEVQTIRPDGNIMLPLVGTVQAAGKTPGELREDLVKLHASYLKHPQLAVIVRNFYERKVYVGGEVNTPGLIDMPGRLTALEAIMQAGSFNMVRAQMDKVTVIRQEGNERKLYMLDMKSAVKGGEHAPFYLQPNDVVYVPPTTITNVAQWLQQHIYELLPSPSITYTID